MGNYQTKGYCTYWYYRRYPLISVNITHWATAWKGADNWLASDEQHCSSQRDLWQWQRFGMSVCRLVLTHLGPSSAWPTAMLTYLKVTWRF